MNAPVRQKAEVLHDAELVAQCLQGDRNAFAQIVERHQSLVCALAYSACGDLALSEDLAQETFLAAWRQLGSLHEPAKLRPWLCGIVRNLTRNVARSQPRNPLATAVALKEEVAGGPDANAPYAQAVSKEEEAILWRVLETLPRTYRDPLILFYRSGNSAAEIADALGVSEEAIRQRLARGRATLNDRVTRLVESGLRRSNPTKAFTVAVLAALPLTSAQASATSATAAITAQSAGMLKTASGLVAAFTNSVAILGGLLGLLGHVENSRSRRERLFLAWSMMGLLAMVVLWLLALIVCAGLLLHYQVIQLTTQLPDAIGLSLLWLAVAPPLDAYVIWMARRQVQIRAEEANTANRSVEAARRGYRLSMYGMIFGMVFGTTGWLFLLAYNARDWTTIWGLLLVGLTGWLVSARWAVKRPASRAQVLIAVAWGLALVNLVAANVRWALWFGGPGAFAPMGVNLLILVLFGSLRAGWFVKQRLLTSDSLRRDSLLLLAVYTVVMSAGIVWFEAARSAEAEPQDTPIWNQGETP